MPGIRDEKALEAALTRARQHWHYHPNADIAELAAAYGWGIARSHPYRDGNKRVAFLAMAIFAELNGLELTATDADVVQAMLDLADHGMTEAELTNWVRAHVRKNE